ncbi:MAG TPA: Maf family protein [Bryobacteraceae bacterium]|jgi:septum formation protein|nr:Maf family protein [Bryobacteraceae bacterium]
MLNLILASRSPRRAELLTAAGFDFTVRAADIDETPRQSEDPRTYVLRMAEEKARAIESSGGEIIIAADTIVLLGENGDGEIMGKPRDADDATRMLRALSGKRHEVITAICLRCDHKTQLEIASTAVWFAPLNDREIEDYVSSGEPMDKAGAYGIQGLASCFIERIDGSYSNVVGLPVAVLYKQLGQFAK